MKKLVLAGIIAVLATGCGDLAGGTNLSSKSGGTISCYSGGVPVFQARYTGRMLSRQSFGGFEFVNTSNNQLTMVSMDCVVVYDK